MTSESCGKGWVSGGLQKVGTMSPQTTGMWRQGLGVEAHPCARDSEERKRAWPLKNQLCPNEGQQVVFAVSRIKNKTNKKLNDYNKKMDCVLSLGPDVGQTSALPFPLEEWL